MKCSKNKLVYLFRLVTIAIALLTLPSCGDSVLSTSKPRANLVLKYQNNNATEFIMTAKNDSPYILRTLVLGVPFYDKNNKIIGMSTVNRTNVQAGEEAVLDGYLPDNIDPLTISGWSPQIKAATYLDNAGKILFDDNMEITIVSTPTAIKPN